MRTDVCLRYRPEVIASAAIFLAGRLLMLKLPGLQPPCPATVANTSTAAMPRHCPLAKCTRAESWWKAFDAPLNQIEDICEIVADLYATSTGPFQYIALSPDDANNELLPPRVRCPARPFAVALAHRKCP